MEWTFISIENFLILRVEICYPILRETTYPDIYVICRRSRNEHMNNQLMKRVGYLILGSFAIFNVISIVLADRFPIGQEGVGKYSIYSSTEFFIVYHAWGIVLAGIVMYAMWKEIRGLFTISLLLLMVVMFYPWFTAGPIGRGEQSPKSNTEINGDSIPVDSGMTDTLNVSGEGE